MKFNWYGKGLYTSDTLPKKGTCELCKKSFMGSFLTIGREFKLLCPEHFKQLGVGIGLNVGYLDIHKFMDPDNMLVDGEKIPIELVHNESEPNYKSIKPEDEKSVQTYAPTFKHIVQTSPGPSLTNYFKKKGAQK